MKWLSLMFLVSCATIHHSPVEKIGVVLYDLKKNKNYYINKDVFVDAKICTHKSLPNTDELTKIFRKEYKKKSTLTIDGMANITTYQVLNENGQNCHFIQGHPVHNLSTKYYDKQIKIELILESTESKN